MVQFHCALPFIKSMNTNFKNILSELEKYIRNTPIDVIRQNLINAGHGVIAHCDLTSTKDNNVSDKNTAIENGIFLWKGCDGNHSCLTFYDCEFVRDFGKFKKGDVVSYINLDNENSEMEIVDYNNKRVRYKVRLELESIIKE